MQRLAAPADAELEPAFVVASVLILWGESAFAGGRWVTIAAVVILLAACVYAVVRGIIGRLIPARFRRQSEPARRRWPLKALGIISLLCAVGVPRWVLYESPVAMYRHILISIYTDRPASEVERFSEWYGPVHVWRSYQHGYSKSFWPLTPVGFHLGLSAGFTATITEDQSGRFSVTVNVDRL